MTDPVPPRLRLRIAFPDLVFGPGKAELLSHIQQTGSISAAGRAMGMSYKRAWSLVEEMNAAFQAPLVASARGGAGGGGAHLTPEGETALRHYQAILQAALQGGASQLAALQSMLRASGDMSDGK